MTEPEHQMLRLAAAHSGLGSTGALVAKWARNYLKRVGIGYTPPDTTQADDEEGHTR